jgi:hypothetical protein
MFLDEHECNMKLKAHNFFVSPLFARRKIFMLFYFLLLFSFFLPYSFLHPLFSLSIGKPLIQN